MKKHKTPSTSTGTGTPNHASNAIHFALQQDQDQRGQLYDSSSSMNSKLHRLCRRLTSMQYIVTLFDSSIVPEPFLDSVGLENLRKRQQAEAAKSTENK